MKRLNGHRPIGNKIIDHAADLLKAWFVDIAHSRGVGEADGASEIAVVGDVDYCEDCV